MYRHWTEWSKHILAASTLKYKSLLSTCRYGHDQHNNCINAREKSGQKTERCWFMLTTMDTDGALLI